MLLLALAVCASAILSMCVGSSHFSIGDVVNGLLGLLDDERDVLIIREVRLPRILLTAIAGAGLGAAGAAYQGLFRNPLADPFVIGSASGSALGATVVYLMGISSVWLGLAAVPAGAFAGSLLATALVYATAAIGRGMNLTRLLLAGAAVGSALNALAWILLMLSNRQLSFIVNTLLGSFSERGWPEFYAAVPWIVVGMIGLLILSRSLDALASGDDVARGLGMRVRLVVALVMMFAGLLVAATVAAGGVIGFIGLVAPFLARPLVGHRHIVVIPASALIGAILLIWSDTIARSILGTSELPVGVVTALLAGPFFLLVLKRGKS
jgi:iron complex transport system permease protein